MKHSVVDSFNWNWKQFYHDISNLSKKSSFCRTKKSEIERKSQDLRDKIFWCIFKVYISRVKRASNLLVRYLWVHLWGYLKSSNLTKFDRKKKKILLIFKYDRKDTLREWWDGKLWKSIKNCQSCGDSRKHIFHSSMFEDEGVLLLLTLEITTSCSVLIFIRIQWKQFIFYNNYINAYSMKIYN